MALLRKCVVSVAQAAPVFLDCNATLDKACGFIAEAGKLGASLVVFPEAFIPAYPDWIWAVPAGEKNVLNALYARFLEQSVEIPGPVTQRLGEAARKAKIHVVIGMSERDQEASGSSLYNSLVYLSADGSLLGKHRKLVPTGGERLVWAQGDGSTLDVYETPIGRLGGLICWENYMPLARYSLYAGGIQLYAAATWDYGEPWLSTLRHIAKEGQVVVLSSGMLLCKSDLPDLRELKSRYYAQAEEWINPGDSAIVSPDGNFLAGPLQKKEGLLTAEVDLAEMPGSRWMLDVAGHYARPDVFELTIHREPHPMLKTSRIEGPGRGTNSEMGL